MNDSYKNGYWGQESENILERQFPLHHACRDGDSNLLSTLLIKAQHSIYEEDSFYGWTPIHWASYFGKLECLQKLMTVTRFGADLDLLTSKFQQSSAHLAAFGNYPHCLEWLLLHKANVSLQDYLGETALHKAARTGSLECCTLLVTNGAKTDLTNNNGQTAAQLASSFGHTQCVRLLESASLQHISNTTHITSSTQEFTHTNSLHQLPSSVHQNGDGDQSCAPQDESNGMEISESVNGAAGDAGVTLESSFVRSPKDITSNFNTIVAGKKRPAIDFEYLGNKKQCLLQASPFLLNGNGGSCENGLVSLQRPPEHNVDGDFVGVRSLEDDYSMTVSDPSPPVQELIKPNGTYQALNFNSKNMNRCIGLSSHYM